jgi:hypothetical protein
LENKQSEEPKGDGKIRLGWILEKYIARMGCE